MMRIPWKYRLALILAGLLLVVGGSVALAAFSGTATDPRTASAGAAESTQEPTEGTDQESTHTPGTEPTKTGQKERDGTITSLDCAKGSLTIMGEEEEDGGTFTALLTSATVFTISGKAGACTDLKVGLPVSIEATPNGTTWTALKVSQGENDQDHDGDEEGSQTTPTPGAGGQTTPTPGAGGD